MNFIIGKEYNPNQLSEEKDFQTYPTINVECLKCNNITGFNIQNFEKYFLNQKSKLSFQNQSIFETFLKDHNFQLKDILYNSFIDYYCPVCNNPIRLYYQAGIGGKSWFSCKLSFVIQ